MKISLELDNGQNPCGLYIHKKLSVCVGQATAAFAQSVLEGGAKPGVWFPEEVRDAHHSLGTHLSNSTEGIEGLMEGIVFGYAAGGTPVQSLPADSSQLNSWTRLIHKLI